MWEKLNPRRNMKFFADDVLLGSKTAKELYESVKALPIIDFHSHLSAREIAENQTFPDLVALWLGSDHYKWRVMRSCGIDEKYITGDAPAEEKFNAYASIMPALAGNPLYYWTHFELKKLFGIQEPLNASTASRIYREANEKLKTLSVRDMLRSFNVEYIATTDDPIAPLDFHGIYDGIRVCPTFRPDRALNPDADYLLALGKACGREIVSLSDWKAAIRVQLDRFLSKGCTIADTGVEQTLLSDVTDAEAEKLLHKRRTPAEQQRFFSYGMGYLGELFCRRHVVWQLHIGALRNINTAAFHSLGPDAGYDVMHGSIDTDALAEFLDLLARTGRLPNTVLYTLNDATMSAICAIAGSFTGVRVGPAWWFNDSLRGIRAHLDCLAEHSALGTFVGMNTDSRSFSSYCRFDFFRRIFADFLADKVEKGEYDGGSAQELIRAVCYRNAKEMIGLEE